MNKRLAEVSKLIDQNKLYGLDEAIDLIKKTSTVKFDASVELHARMGIDPKKGDQQIRSTVILPHGTGKTKIVAAFVSADNAEEAKDAGADFIYDEEDIKKIKSTGKIEFEIAVATPQMMPKIAMIAKILGPKGLMPNPKTGTIGPNIKQMVTELKKGKVAFKNDDTANVHQIIGKVSFENSKLVENVQALLDTIKRIKPTSVKGTYIKALYLSSSMGPSIKIEIPA